MVLTSTIVNHLIDIGRDSDSAESANSVSALAQQSQSANTDKITFPDNSGLTTNALPLSIVASWGRILQSPITKRLYDRIVRVAGVPEGWRGAGSLGLRTGSLNNFLKFWTMVHEQASEPELTLSPDGYLHAEWFKSAKQRLDIKFSEPKIMFGLLANNEIVEGSASIDNIVPFLLVHSMKPLSWKAP